MGKNFVLVHGAWHGAWCWAAVINQLEKLGDRALALDLPGHGASRVDRAGVTLKTYVDGVVDFIEQRDLSDVVLTGHSMGGLVISGVMQRIPRRLSRAIFVSAMVMLDGERPIDPESPAIRPVVDLVMSRPDKSLPIDAMADRFRSEFIQDAPPELQDFVIAALTPQPIAPLIDPVPMDKFAAAGVPTSYLVCEDDISRAAEGSNWHPHFSSRLDNPTIRAVKSGHEVMFTKPVECARALYELART